MILNFNRDLLELSLYHALKVLENRKQILIGQNEILL